MRAGASISGQDARWLAIAAEGLGRPRPDGPITRRQLRVTVEAIATVQLDAINVVERTQFLVLFSRLGAYDVARFRELTGPNGALLEYWGHAASLMPMEWQPLFRWRMAQGGVFGSELRQQRRRAVRERARRLHHGDPRRSTRTWADPRVEAE